MLLSTTLQDEPNIIVRPIAIFLGWILNFIYNIVYAMNHNMAFGLSIILFTIVVRALMIPLAIKQQKSTAAMQKLQPELEKIKNKYGDSKDPEIQKKMTAETQALYAKGGVNPLSGCLPLLIQFPIFIALSYIMRESYLFIDKMGYVYVELANLVKQVTPDWFEAIRPLGEARLADGKKFDIGIFNNLQKLLYSFTPQDWEQYLARVPADIAAKMSPLIGQIDEVKGLTYFLGINLLNNPELRSISILIPILCAVTTFLQSWIMNKATVAVNDSAKTQQRIMLVVMPLMMGYFTFTFPAGVGLYWLTSTVFYVFQQMVLNKRYLPESK